MTSRSDLKGDSLSWLLETEAPGVRYLALRDLCDLAEDDPDLVTARIVAHQEGPIATILAAMHDENYWVEPGPGYRPKYRSTVWSIIMLAQLGASVREDERIAQACAYLMDHALVSGGRFAISGTPSTTVDCLQGNLCWALPELDYQDERLETAIEWMARSVTGEGVAPKEDRQAELRYYAGKCGPDFLCGANNGLACAWGAVKVMMAFGSVPHEQRTSLVEEAIERGIALLLGTDPAEAGYPTGYAAKPSGNWWKFGFPVFYVTDLLQLVEALVRLGYGNDPRLANALALIKGKQDDQGRWPLEYDYRGKTWIEVGAKRQPNKWVTLRALRVLKAAA